MQDEVEILQGFLQIIFVKDLCNRIIAGALGISKSNDKSNTVSLPTLLLQFGLFGGNVYVGM